jgi:hypothetical protein
MTYDSAAKARNRQLTHRIELHVVRYGGRGPVYRVSYDGQTLLASSRCPLLDACRALLTRGVTGRLELWRSGRTSFDVAADIEEGAKWTILETETESLRLARWTPSPWKGISRRGVAARTAICDFPVPDPHPGKAPILGVEPVT